MIEKVTSLELANIHSCRDFTAEVTAVHASSVNLRINEKTYSIKTPLDFKVNKLEEGDIIDVVIEVVGTERVSLGIAAVYVDGRKIGLERLS